MDSSAGRGRGLALLEALKKSSGESIEPPPTIARPNVPPSTLQTGSDVSIARGRGLAFLQALKKSHGEAASSSSDSPEATPLPSSASSIVGSAGMMSASTLGGRGRAAALLSKLQHKPGPSFSPASDISPSMNAPTVPKSAGRGLRLLQNLASTPQPVSAGVSEVAQQMAATTISTSTVAASSIAKNKHYKEVKDTPPVVKKGESGTKVEVSANFVYLKFEENNVFEYEVVYQPSQDYKHLRFKLLNEHSHFFKEKTFDGTTLYVPHMLPDEALKLVSTNPFDQSTVNITILFRRTRRLSEMIHIYNVLFKAIMKDLQLVRFARQHFSEHAAIQIPQHKLEVWPGYVTAVDEYEGGLMLTLDSTHRVLRTESVLSLIKDTVQSAGTNWKRVINETLIGSSVMTTYNKKLFRVDSIDDSMNPTSTFEKNEKGTMVKISYVDYYKNNYGIEIKDWNQPMLISRETKRVPGHETPVDFMICLVPELCQMTGLTDDQRSNFRLMKDVATYTRITPNQRHAAFKKYIQNVLANEKAKSRLTGWGLSIAPETIDLAARTLQPEAITFGNGVKVPGKPNAEWNNDVTRNPVISAVDILKWVILYTERDKQVTLDFLDTLKRSCRPMGINVSNPELVKLANDRTDSYVMALKKCLAQSIQIVVAICPTARDDRYSAIKKICCADNPVPSQVINARTIMNQNKIRAITQKILLQMNCKLGGTLWQINVPFKTAMVVGIDSYHEVAKKKNSVCAFVASSNAAMTRWYSRAFTQAVGQEIGDGIKACFANALKHYISVNGNFPDRIIIYRDGVGDGQLSLVKNYEVKQMKDIFKELGMDFNPVLTYIVVQKRINTRIFLKAPGGFENPAPGTVLDHTITRRDWYDFLIVSQKVNQGTVTPTHYIVVHDDSTMTPDQCQRLTYKMCHLYYNWPGTVRVPAPCQYAHKLAYLVGQSVRQTPSDVLADKLYFL